MRVLIVGATGVLGRLLVQKLSSSGQEVWGVARTPAKMRVVEEAGGRATVGDILSRETMRSIVRQCDPEAIVNLATAIPLKLRVVPHDWVLNDRVRLEGTTNLLEAAKQGKPRLFVQESVGYVCASQGASWMDEDAPRSSHPFLKATCAMEDRVRASGIPATVLRFAAVIGSESWHTQQSVTALRAGLLPIIGAGDAYVSQIHAFDAAEAITAVLGNVERAAGKTYNVVESDPAPMHTVLPYAAKVLEAHAPRRVPSFVAKVFAGALTVEVLTASYRLRGERLCQELGFALRYPTYKEIWAEIAEAVREKTFHASPDLK